jgi:dTDP-4-amino-4,6-dideoxygalactose transaminase
MSYERSTGHSTAYDVVELGYNYRIDDLRSAIGLVQLEKLLPDLEKRSIIRKQYINELRENERILIPFSNFTEFSSNYIMPIVLKESNCEFREKVRTKMAESGIQTSVHYPAVHRFSIYKKYYRELPKTDYVSSSLITLPMYSKLNEYQIEYICNTLKNALC